MKESTLQRSVLSQAWAGMVFAAPSEPHQATEAEGQAQPQWEGRQGVPWLPAALCSAALSLSPWEDSR